tara:strand:- start:390 stop:764 length:375 start_codon:yes stop_codon:yes gene_type:complete
MKVIVFCTLILVSLNSFTKESIWTCTDESNFITSFKLDDYKNSVIHMGSIVSNDDDSSNAGETYSINEELEVLKWDTYKLIAYDFSEGGIYIRIFDFESRTNTILVPGDGSEQPYATKATCFVY